MLPEIKYKPVNWIDGMKISKTQFIATENAFFDHLRDATAAFITDFNYGLLPTVPGGLPSLEISVNFDANKTLTVKLLTCRAISPNGSRIEILNVQPLTLTVTLEKLLSDHSLNPQKDYEFFIVVSVNPFERVPAGEPDVSHLPPRHPYTLPTYQLSILPVEQLNSQTFNSFHLVIGKLLYEKGELKQDAPYIPPSMAVNSMPGLQKWYYDFDRMFNGIENGNEKGLEKTSFEIIKKIKTRRDKASSLSESVNILCEKLVTILASQLTAFKWIVPQQAPVYLAMWVMDFIRQIDAALNCLPDGNREEMLQYFEHWSPDDRFTRGRIRSAFADMPHLAYNHLDCEEMLSNLRLLIDFLNKLFRTLAELEFIGKTRQGGIFVSEKPAEVFTQQVEQTKFVQEPIKEEPPKKKFSILGD